ncbi:MAG: hypothetical protein DRN66_03505 [Candidatus Nanohalarchaeota archaeon]|nr:MAG: hypothetical protein DRN66_03505 [Candidatus Nanohaloarchaeota archaeon]
MIFSKIAALDINKRIETNAEIIIPQTRETGTLGLSDEMKRIIWETLGPVKSKKKIEELKTLLENKEVLTSQEKLLKKIAETCLLRKESIGAFYREDLEEKQTARGSYLISENIIFK